MAFVTRYILLAGSVTLFGWLVTSPASSYERWGDGCPDCHQDFTNDFSTKPNNTWPDDKHEVHRRDMMNSLCGTCHVTNGDDPLLNFSGGTGLLPGLGCMGCHGIDPTPGTENNFWGAGLRLHHANANVGEDDSGFECIDCHDDDPLPVPEDVVPAYYGGTGINVFDPCNADGAENWTSDGLGLDNDGDGDYDGADADCPVFTDGFESGDTAAWSTTLP